MKSPLFLNFTAVIALTLGLGSCISTDTVTPGSDESSVKEIVVNISTPDELKSRADNGYRLRYVAKIFQGVNQNNIYFIQRQDILDGDLGEKGVNNQLIFKVPANDNYFMYVFADYIPDPYTKSNDGFYKDYYYDTRTDFDYRATLRPTPGTTNDKLSESFFNNDNYDCFFAMESFLKEESEKVLNMTLQRNTAKVIVKDLSLNAIENLSLRISNMNTGCDFDYPNLETTFSPLYNSITLEINTDGSEEQELLYFYTIINDSDREKKINFDLRVSHKDLVEPYNISLTDIPVKRNYRTIVKDSFIPSPASDPQPEDPDPDTNKAGDIILNLSTAYGWSQEPLSKE